MVDLAYTYRGWVEEALSGDGQLRDCRWWSESIAVGSELFVTITKEKLGAKAKGREVVGGGNGSYVLQEPPAPYNTFLGHENDVLSLENAFFWGDNS